MSEITAQMIEQCAGYIASLVMYAGMAGSLPLDNPQAVNKGLDAIFEKYRHEFGALEQAQISKIISRAKEMIFAMTAPYDEVSERKGASR